MQATRSEIERLEAVNEALQRGDRDEFRRRIADLMHPDCEWSPLITAVDGGTYRGREGMAEFFEDFIGTFEVRYVKPQYRMVGPSTVLLLVTMEVRGRESGVEIPRELGLVFEFEDGLARRARAYDSHARALAEAGVADA